MVQSDLLGPRRRGLVQVILKILRDFDLVHRKKINHPDYEEMKTGNAYGYVNFEDQKIYIRKISNGIESQDTILHELRHVFQEFYMNTEKWTVGQNEDDAIKGAIYWMKILYEDLKRGD